MFSQKKAGAIIQYFNICLTMAVNIFFTPFLISSLGNSEYGVYKIVQSFSSQLMIMNFGISALVVRNIVFYNIENKKEEKENFLFMSNAISHILAIVVVLIGTVLYFNIDNIYANSLTAEEIITSKRLFAVLVLNIAITIISDSAFGTIRAYEKFIVSNGINLLRCILRVGILVLLLNMGVKSLGIVLTDLSLTVATNIFARIYARFKLKERAKFHYVDKQLFIVCLSFSAAIILQSIVNQVNQNVDNIILGIMTGAETVAIYSVALTLYGSFNGIVYAMTGIFAPNAIRLVAQKATGEELTDFVIKIGRIQFIIAGAVISGFILFGKNFLDIWVGKEFEDVYKIALILIIPVTIPLIENVTNSILDAMLKRLYRSIILVVMAFLNVVFSIILIKKVGYVGAAYGTAVSLLIGHGIIMNIYFKKVIGLNIKRLFKEVFSGTVKAILIVLAVCFPLSLLPFGWKSFICQMMVFIVAYLGTMYYFGMNSNEKSLVLGVIDKVRKKKA